MGLRQTVPYFAANVKPPDTGTKTIDCMEQLNKIILRGLVGNAAFRSYDGKGQNRFSIATSYAFKSRDGQANIETLWLPVSAWEGRNISLQDLQQIEKGTVVYVEGRLRLNKFVNTEGVEKQSHEVIANYLRIEDEMAATQMA